MLSTQFRRVVLDTTKVQIFKQITTFCSTSVTFSTLFQIPQRYRFSSKSQLGMSAIYANSVVLDTTKVQIFKQITTTQLHLPFYLLLFQIPQRYRFSSKSQPEKSPIFRKEVVLDTTKVQIFKQITTTMICQLYSVMLFQIPQRYRFSSKSQLLILLRILVLCCFRYHKGTDFQANHNYRLPIQNSLRVVLDTTKVQIFKQITTFCSCC